ncbi:MAG: TIGR03862 family flavoprotein, partial [Anaerolineae bacterium]|nr:TIGR03862 family flavoprotein [Anaerolineae bacterium]
MSHQVAIIGGGPAGLMAAEVLLQGGAQVALYETMPSPGRKFLVAGKGGLNLTHSEPYEYFLSRYGNRRPQIEPLLDVFGPKELCKWADDLGVETFIGSSGRVFPKGMKTTPLLNAWLDQLKDSGLEIFTRHKWIGWGEDNSLRFETPDGEKIVEADATILALGGGSRPELGSDGSWIPLLVERSVEIAPLKPSNCGFNLNWTDLFRDKFEGEPIKPVAISFKDKRKQGEFIITKNGVEGSLIYAFSAQIRDEIERAGSATIELDLMPDWTEALLIENLSQPRGSRSVSSHLKRTINLTGVKTGLLWEYLQKKDFLDPNKLATKIKALP